MNSSYIDILNERTINPTANRILILKAMLKYNKAFTLSDLEMEMDTIDKSTISRTIHLFHEKQLIHSFDDGSGSVKYSVCSRDCHCSIDDLHAHFYCNYCNNAFCLKNIAIPEFALSPVMQVESVNLVIKGYCGQCNKLKK
ncbi:Fur family transcriptional regulator [Dysgonomonas gadei]|uniref:Transcriptional repressor n=1 Tax=Dysgonomonas gadei ATCC BAA-286 TaxID=742766 RepID=F5IXB8_9BACT|nr:transcriptional repressor [Dysgonomonas gadei]EGK02101.1 hypothetical protein HMPREF9455_01735 [Dysgonomonas gadei ATCC BAA-286]